MTASVFLNAMLHTRPSSKTASHTARNLAQLVNGGETKTRLVSPSVKPHGSKELATACQLALVHAVRVSSGDQMTAHAAQNALLQELRTLSMASMFVRSHALPDNGGVMTAIIAFLNVMLQ